MLYNIEIKMYRGKKEDYEALKLCLKSITVVIVLLNEIVILLI